MGPGSHSHPGPPPLLGVHWSLEALARSRLAANVVSCREVMVKAENRSCGEWRGRAEWGRSELSLSLL